MIDKTNIIPTLLRRLDKLTVGHCLDVRSYKRDRGLLIIKTAPASYRIIEDGFEKRQLEVAEEGLKKTLKGLVKREFPRSNRLRVYDLGRHDEGDVPTLKRKVL